MDNKVVEKLIHGIYYPLGCPSYSLMLTVLLVDSVRVYLHYRKSVCERAWQEASIEEQTPGEYNANMTFYQFTNSPWTWNIVEQQVISTNSIDWKKILSR